jgi:hypothetical protein
MKRVVDWIMRNHDKMIFSGGIVGSNIGVYHAAKHDESYIYGVSAGFLVGCGIGCMLPVIVPVAIVSSPGYLAYHLKNGFQSTRELK